MSAKSDYARTVDEAVNFFAERGFASEADLKFWEEKIRRAAEAAMGPRAKMEDLLRDVLRAAYEKMLTPGVSVKLHPGIGRFTLEKVKPELRAELDRRIMAAANLIRIKRRTRIEETLARFSGWATSVPAGGSGETDKREEKAKVKKPLASLPFEERRVLTDQGHKLFSSLNEITATGGGAIAAIWHSRWRQPNYDYRPDHKERDLRVYLIRDSWAISQGLVKKAGLDFIDEVSRPAEEPFCRCSYQYLYALPALQRVAPDALTKLGEAKLAAARAKVAA